jgi:hypothetical protein
VHGERRSARLISCSALRRRRRQSLDAQTTSRMFDSCETARWQGHLRDSDGVDKH